MPSVCAATQLGIGDDDENDVAYELIAMRVCLPKWILFRRNRIDGSYFACECMCNSQIHGNTKFRKQNPNRLCSLTSKRNGKSVAL